MTLCCQRKFEKCHTDIGTINTRLETVAELLENEEVFFNVQSLLGRFLDVDHLLSLCIQVSVIMPMFYLKIRK